MDIRTLTPAYSVSPQIDPADAAEIKAQGFETVICNRPDAEVPPAVRSDAMRAAVEAEGLTFVDNPVTHQGLNMDMVDAQSAAAQNGKTLAYCASGTRSTIVWAMGQAGRMPVDEIIETAAKAGYDLSGMRPQLETLS
ncbi:TIGR01244 family phosphatase [Salipiger sp. IMCC34102]|uniref:TIGR01244 family sulfur transferase n=1 Tax=Salipiger sp. IMCC34102 TaxID=2510647 RepID=UPI00101C78D0|nr:TIGR01244 family sulfur transferase [Salipiger sp. IMCC34102]RYH02730.1 TIGR01244 family phosphatase [Salipiger sp. IMCC34102]